MGRLFPEEMRKWNGWRKWNIFDATVLFWGITMVTTIIFRCSPYPPGSLIQALHS
jgi:hypothetical protein